jgi:hypothetical protein
MPHHYIDSRATIEITTPYVDAVHRYGVAALERLRAFGFADRRESGVALLLAGGVPLAGLLLLGWSPSSVVLAVLANLLLNLYSDLFKILRMRGRLSEQQRLCNQDDFVWPVARALMRRETTMPAKHLPTLESLQESQPAGGAFVWAILATIAIAIPGWIVVRDDELYAEPATLFFGTLPNMLLFAGAAIVQSLGRNARWREAASVRLGTAMFDGSVAFFAGFAAVGFFVRFHPSDPVDPERLAAIGCAGVVLAGCYRLAAAVRLLAPARWLEGSLAHRARYPHLHEPAPAKRAR